MEIDPWVSKLKTPEDCEQFIINVRDKHPELVIQAERRAIELRAELQGSSTDAEREALEAVFAYETILTKRNGKKTRASRTWQMIKRHGIIGAIERVVSRESDAKGYAELAAMNMKDLSFEAIVVRHPNAFSAPAVEQSRKRLREYEANS